MTGFPSTNTSKTDPAIAEDTAAVLSEDDEDDESTDAEVSKFLGKTTRSNKTSGKVSLIRLAAVKK